MARKQTLETVQGDDWDFEGTIRVNGVPKTSLPDDTLTFVIAISDTYVPVITKTTDPDITQNSDGTYSFSVPRSENKSLSGTYFFELKHLDSVTGKRKQVAYGDLIASASSIKS